MAMWLLLLILLPVIVFVYDWWHRRPWVDGIHRKAVLITGCDTGFGNAAAKSLYGRGVYVYAGCYAVAGAEKLRQETGDRLKTIILDVSKTQSIQDAYKYVSDTLPKDIEFWGIINNAGVVGQPGPIEFLNIDDFKQIFNVNFYGMVEVTQTFLPLIKKSKGRIVNTCSIAAILPCPNASTYGTTKWAAMGFSEALRVEKSAWGINVSAIAPGGFNTHIARIDPIDESYRRRWDQLDPEIRDQYGEDYVTRAVNNIAAQSARMFKDDLSPVVHAYENALFSVHPRNVYYPGGEILKYLPLSIMLKVFDINKILPKAVQKQ